jgi:hypothetical protein
MTIAHKIVGMKCEGKRQLGRPRHRRVDNGFEIDLR